MLETKIDNLNSTILTLIETISNNQYANNIVSVTEIKERKPIQLDESEDKKENELDRKYLSDKTLRLSRKYRSKRHKILSLLEKFKAKTITQLEDSQLANFNQDLDFIYNDG